MWIQCSEPVKSRCPAYDLYGKLRFASHLRAKVGSQGPLGSARAQAWSHKKVLFSAI